MQFNPASFVRAAGLQNTSIGRGVIGLGEERAKVQRLFYVYAALITALVFGITAIILLSTGVSSLANYGEYFSVTQHKVGAFAFVPATFIALFTANWLLDDVLECAETSLARAQARQ
jgi:hypothetical protein